MPSNETSVVISCKSCKLRSHHAECRQLTAEKGKEVKKFGFALSRSCVQYSLLCSDLFTAADPLLRLAAFLFSTDEITASLQAVSGRHFWLPPTLSAVSLSEHSRSRAVCAVIYLSAHPTLILLCRHDKRW